MTVTAQNDKDTADDGVLDATIAEARAWLENRQDGQGAWLFELEADATIPAEFVMLNHFLGAPDAALETKIGNYLRRIQEDHGGWPLYPGGDFNMSATVKAYYALKLIGEDPDAPHMAKARLAVLAHGGAAKSNVFTRIALALFEQVPWRAAPVIRPEAMFLPSWSPFHIGKVAYWSRTVMIPLFVLAALKPKAKNPRGVHIRELFTTDPFEQTDFLENPTGSVLGNVFLAIDKAARLMQPMIPEWLEKKAIGKCMDFVKVRLNGDDGLGGIFPAMANAVMAYEVLGYDRDHPDYTTARASINKLLIERDDEAYCQPCLSPVWDTGLALHALQESGLEKDNAVLDKAAEWLIERQITDVVGDWGSHRPNIRPGGWAFQFRNDHYPDVDDTAVVVMALHRADPVRYKNAIDRGVEWIIGMQSESGGWGAFDADNEHYHLNHIPFADHGALLDPPSADVSARCLGMLAQLGYGRDDAVVRRAIEYLKREQEEDGSWFGRWGTNYIYGTWSVLSALNAVGEDMQQSYIRHAVDWLKARQLGDGGWGEDCSTYWHHRRFEVRDSTPSQTAWAIMGLMAAGELEAPEVERGVDFLLTHPREGGKWTEAFYNAVGFPKVFYLTYHGYSAYFPLWSLARYRNLKRSNTKRPAFGI
ncbi:MAG: squalene--hopene cyclase [Rhodospirillaceae bacterium]